MTPTLIHENAADGPRRKRWSEQIRDAYGAVDIALSPDTPFHGTITASDLPGLKLSLVHSGAQRLTRTQPVAHAADDGLIVTVQMLGHAELSQDGRRASLSPGAFAVCDSLRPFTLEFAAEFEQLVLGLRGDRMRAIMARTDLYTATTISGGHGAGRLLIAALDSLRAQRGNLVPASETAVVDSVLHLLMACQQSLPAHAKGPVTAMSSYHLARIKQRIVERLHDPALTIESVAAELTMSEGHLHRLFKSEPLSPSQYMWARRLEACSRELTDPQRAKEAIAEIAFRWGFRNAAHFSRSFRERFGVTPREWRRQTDVDA